MLKLLLVAAVVLILMYVVASRSLTAVGGIREDPEEGAKSKLSYSPFPITFRDQYLCYSSEDGLWVMRGQREQDDCEGPFIDSENLCNALEAVGQDRVQLFWEGRVYECS